MVSLVDAMAVETVHGYDATMPLAIPGMVVVQAGKPTEFLPGMAMGVALGTVVRARSTQIVEQQRGQLVEIGAVGPTRTIRKDRRLMVLAGKWRCSYCKAFGPRDSEATKCASCGAPRRGAEVGEVDTKEAARFDARKKSAIGRRLNKTGCGEAALVERVAVGEAFDLVQKKQLVRLELGTLETAIGGVHYMEDQESNMSVIEGFLVVHYLGKYSIAAHAGKADGLDGLVVADFFNALGRLTTAGGERNFPMGGYYNLFRAGGVTARLLSELYMLLWDELSDDEDERHAQAVMKNANTFRAWYTSAAGRAHRAYEEAEMMVKEAARSFFAGLYAPGGRLGYVVTSERRGVSADDMEIAWLPCAVLHDVLYRVCSGATQTWVLKHGNEPEAVLDISRGFRSQFDDETNEENLYSGSTALQLRKTFSICARAAGSVKDPVEMADARKAVFLAVKNMTRHKKYQAMAMTDDVAVEITEHLDLEYNWDLSMLAAIGDSETLAYRRMEVYQQQQADSEMVAAGERATLPKSKADKQSEGLVRLKKHRRGCPFEGKLGCSLESACPKREDGKLDGRFRCQVCCKRLLFERQGPHANGGPAYVKLSPCVRPSWEDPNKGKPEAQTASEGDFVYGEALGYNIFQEMLDLVLPLVNKQRVLRKLTPYLARVWHWHGWRHGCAMNLYAMEAPAMTELQIAQWCRMSLRVLMIYLKHNRTGPDATNRTDAITGVSSLTFQVSGMSECEG